MGIFVQIYDIKGAVFTFYRQKRRIWKDMKIRMSTGVGQNEQKRDSQGFYNRKHSETVNIVYLAFYGILGFGTEYG